MATLSVIRVVQIALSALGLIMSVSSTVYILMVVAFVLAMMYEAVFLILWFLNKIVFSSRTQTTIEIVLGVIILFASIYCAITCTKDIYVIMATVTGIVLAALLFLTAYDSNIWDTVSGCSRTSVAVLYTCTWQLKHEINVHWKEANSFNFSRINRLHRL